MIKQINRILKLVGYNLIRAKRKKTLIERRNNEVEVPMSDYMGETEWQNTPPVAVPVPNPGTTHYVGDNCPGGHQVGTQNICIGPEAKVLVVDPDAAFVPVDIGVGQDEIPKSTK